MEKPDPAPQPPASLALPDPWTHLRRYTAARVALGRVGGSQPTRAILEFRLAHAQARDAVQAPWDFSPLQAGLSEAGCETVVLETDAPDRKTHLLRPDLGRRLSDRARTRWSQWAAAQSDPVDLVLVVSDGLSSTAASRQALPVLEHLLPLLRSRGWRVAPVVLSPFGRVKLQDEIGGLARAPFSLMLIGERPGLSSPDSLGAYLTAGPSPEKTDADRNCLSNIRPEGLPPPAAARKLLWLLEESRRTGLFGIHLKDTESAGALEGGGTAT